MTYANTKTLLKILIGTAWIDGEIQPEERHHLNRIAADAELADDDDIKALLQGSVKVTPQHCYGWVQAYLGSDPTADNCRQLMESISALVYSDGVVDLEEAKLLNHLQTVSLGGNTPQSQNSEAVAKGVISSLRQFYRSLVTQK
ncbi:MAG: TerB family tellurite resistance protein [Cyanobacteria bacterium P01_H01_bin.119]